MKKLRSRMGSLDGEHDKITRAKDVPLVGF